MNNAAEIYANSANTRFFEAVSIPLPKYEEWLNCQKFVSFAPPTRGVTFFSSAEDGGERFHSVWWHVCGCQQNVSKSSRRILMNFLMGGKCDWQRWLDFDDVFDHNVDTVDNRERQTTNCASCGKRERDLAGDLTFSREGAHQ